MMRLSQRPHYPPPRAPLHTRGMPYHLPTPGLDNILSCQLRVTELSQFHADLALEPQQMAEVKVIAKAAAGAQRRAGESEAGCRVFSCQVELIPHSRKLGY